MNFPNSPQCAYDCQTSMPNFNNWCLRVAGVAVLLPLVALSFADGNGERGACPVARTQYGTSTPAAFVRGGSPHLAEFKKACEDEKRAAKRQ